MGRLERVCKNLPILPSEGEKPSQIKLIFIAFWGLALLFAASFRILNLGAAAVFLLVFCVWAYKQFFPSPPEPATKSFYDFGEKLLFANDNLTITSPIKECNHVFLYADMENMVLCYRFFRDDDFMSNIAVLRWNVKGKNHQYTIPIEAFGGSRDLVEVLQHLYQAVPSIQELGDKGEKLYLLEPIKKAEIAEKYIDMIDEIGDKTEK